MGLNCSQLAEEIGKTVDYVRKIETGLSRTVSPEVYRDLCHRLRLDDRRVLLADPWGDDPVDQSTEDEAVSAG